MPRAAPIITALNAGQFSPLMQGRADLTKYASGSKRLENVLPLVQGPGCRRGGTVYLATTKTAASRSWLVKFEFSATDAFALEFGEQYIRFYSNAHSLVGPGTPAAWSGVTNYTIGDLVVQGGVNYYCIAAHINQVPPNATYWYAMPAGVYEIPSPYTAANLVNDDGTFALKIEQSGDVLYIANLKRTISPRKLTRFATTRWVMSEYLPSNGPFLETNGSAVTIIASATTGSVTLTASAATFAATDVGRLVRLASQDLSDNPWETGKVYVASDRVRFGGKSYTTSGGGTSGTSPPVHESGAALDGKTGVTWTYLHSGYGVARITAYTSSTLVTASVVVDSSSGLNALPVQTTTTASTRWALGAWSASSEYPGTVAFWENRLWWGGRLRLWGSVPNDFESMAGDFFGLTTTDAAIWWQLQSRDINDILWLVGADRLLIGTGGGEFTGMAITDTSPIGPENFRTPFQGRRRSRSTQPQIAGESVLYVQRAGRKLMSMNYELTDDKYASNDLAVLADRITRSGIIDMAFQSEPWQILWCVLANGKLLGFTYDRDQEVVGWHPHPLGGSGIVESVIVLPSADGARDEVWLQVRRTINGSTVRYIEWMERPWEGPDEDGTGSDEQEDAYYVDCGKKETVGAAQTLWTAFLPHLVGETVQCLGDGAVMPDVVVGVGGTITVSRAVSTLCAGLQYISRIVPNRLEAGAADGTAQGKKKRIDELTVRFVDTLGGKIGRYNPTTREGEALESISYRAPSTPMGSPPPISSYDYTLKPFPGDYDTHGLFEIRQDQPLPMTVAAIMPDLKTY